VLFIRRQKVDKDALKVCLAMLSDKASCSVHKLLPISFQVRRPIHSGQMRAVFIHKGDRAKIWGK